MVAVPADTPLTKPVVAFTTAVIAPELIHVPPVGPLVSVVVEPTHTVCVPLIAVGNALTVKDVVI